VAGAAGAGAGDPFPGLRATILSTQADATIQEMDTIRRGYAMREMAMATPAPIVAAAPRADSVDTLLTRVATHGRISYGWWGLAGAESGFAPSDDTANRWW
jgi:hypothetical protein